MVVERADEAVRCFNSRYEVHLEPDAYRLNRQAFVLLSSEENEYRTNEHVAVPTASRTDDSNERVNTTVHETNERTNGRRSDSIERGFGEFWKSARERPDLPEERSLLLDHVGSTTCDQVD